MVVKIRLIRCQACLIERALRVLEFQQARRTPLIRLLGNTKGLFRFGQGFCGIDLQDLLARLVCLVRFVHIGDGLQSRLV